MEQVISVREIQRNYRKLANLVKTSKKPLFLGAHFKPELVVLDYKHYKISHGQAFKPKKSWSEIEKTLNWVAKGGKQKTNLGRAIYEDRKKH